MSRFSFHWVLSDISKQINSDTLDRMKYKCRGVLSAMQMDKIKTSLDLLKELEECGKISDGDVAFLIQLLESEGKSKLVPTLLLYNYNVANETMQESLSFSPEEHSQQQPVRNSQGKYYLVLYI